MSLKEKIALAKKKLEERDGAKCIKCPSTNELTVDHIIPVSLLEFFGIKREQSYTMKKHGANLQLLCRACNSLKSNRVDWSDKRSLPLLQSYIDKLHEDLSEEDERSNSSTNTRPILLIRT